MFRRILSFFSSVALAGVSRFSCGTTMAFAVGLLVAAWPLSAVAQTNFGTVNIGSNTTETVIVTIPNAATLGSIAVVTQGAPNLDFTNAGGGTCTVGTAYANNATCTVIVNFAPKFAGARYGAVVLGDANGVVVANAYLQGAGVGPQVIFSPGTQTVIGSGLLNPFPIAVDGSGNVYIGDIGYDGSNAAVYKETLQPNGSYAQSEIGSGWGFPQGIAVDGGGNVYVADSGNHLVSKETLQPNGSYTQITVASCVTSGTLDLAGVAVDGGGNVYVPDFYNGILYKETPSNGGYIQSEILGCECGPLAADESGNLYVVNDRFEVLKETPSNGTYTETAIYTSDDYGIGDVTVDGSGNVYLNSFYPNGLLGTYKLTLQPNGSYTQSTIGENTTGIAVDGSGNLYLTNEAGSTEVTKVDNADPPTLSFANTVPGLTSVDSPQTLTVGNLDNEPLKFSAVSYATDFPENSSETTDCTASTSLLAGETCTLTIDFTPVTPFGGKSSLLLSESVTITTNTLNTSATPQAATVTGTEVQLGQVAATPVISPPTGTYNSVQMVYITDTTAGAVIHFTTDDTTPTTSSPKYVGAITVSATETIQAIAAAPGCSNSAVASATYTLILPAAIPAISPASGTYTSAQSVTITDTTTGAAIYYTNDGTTPTTNSTPYTGAFTVSSSVTIQAIAVATGYISSAVALASYTINLPPPDFSVAASPTSLTISYGQPGKTTVTVTPQSEFASAVSFSCSGLPSGASCSFSPTTVTPSGAAASTTLTVSTTAAASSVVRQNSRQLFLGGTTLAIGLCFLGWKKRCRAQLLLAVCVCGLGLIAGCGSGGSSSTPPPPSTVTVTATSGSLQHTTTFSLTVQ
jgi:hypothetical protein